MVTILPLQPEQAREARCTIYTVAHELFEHSRVPPEEAFLHYESRWPIPDVEDFQHAYLEHGGIFLVLVEDGKIIGTGALKKLEDGVAELKRLWLLSEYQGQGFGYQMTMRLLDEARRMGYRCVRLETSPEYQQRAFNFYRRIGFYEISKYGDDPDDVSMEIVLDQQQD